MKPAWQSCVNRDITRFAGYYRRRGKRLLDLSLTVPGLFVVGPLLGIIALFIARNMGRPVLFRQQRPGLNGRPFELVKFRTMRDTRDEDGNLLPDEQRLTSLGHILRSTSLDELPEIWNVLKGDMSLVGPRPLLMQYLSRYTIEQARRHEVQPGMTGWAQINGRNAITWEKKFHLDLWYVKRQSLKLDLQIIALSMLRVFQRKGISASGQATMPEFLGSLMQ
ncbi:Uncharacterized sugar transferase EpsL [uncultured Desulfatiglans sp.]|nr:Uncharacterized sugar transferase EpsL [uncultured Desulfatiglans sp.]